MISWRRLAAGALLCAGCGKGPPTEGAPPAPTAAPPASTSGEDAPLVCPSAAPGAAVDPPLLAFLSSARSAHHLADERERSDDPAGAIHPLTNLLRGPLPADQQRPEVREVLADTRARLASLLSRTGRFDEASEQIRLGLALVPETTYWRGHLFEQRGHLEERRAETLRAAGREDEARLATERALAAFARAIDVQSKVIECSLEVRP